MSRSRRRSPTTCAASSPSSTTATLGARLARLLSPPELAAVAIRGTDLLRDGEFPEPEPGYHSVPWPMV